MVDLNGHEAGNGGYSQGRPTARRVLLYSERCLVIPENEMLAPPGVYLPARSAFLRLAWDRMRTIKVIRSARASRFCACPPSYAKDAPCMLEFPGARSWLLAAFVQPPGVEITLSPYQTICRSPLSTDRGLINGSLQVPTLGYLQLFENFRQGLLDLRRRRARLLL